MNHGGVRTNSIPPHLLRVMFGEHSGSEPDSQVGIPASHLSTV